MLFRLEEKPLPGLPPIFPISTVMDIPHRSPQVIHIRCGKEGRGFPTPGRRESKNVPGPYIGPGIRYAGYQDCMRRIASASSVRARRIFSGFTSMTGRFVV